MADARATGWKVPLLFCAAVLCAVGITALLRQKHVEMPPIPAALLEQAQAIVINLDGTEEGRKWKADISGVAGAFATRAEKDARITALVRLAVRERRFDAACTASVLMYGDHLRDDVLREVGDSALEDCATLPWGVMAAKGMRDASMQAELHGKLITRWQQCGGR